MKKESFAKPVQKMTLTRYLFCKMLQVKTPEVGTQTFLVRHEGHI